ncbi:hypothetical protein Glove_272g32 [Diversispora epigaea]|uniref:Uncharacterized protein n=1 Tax=Diversispora epigaea TaxID=1348612 RepID=A0A397I484_9GLOM|nr:hypothetical protein Glove_272g32 [Diversispora epigaea]
MGRRSKQKNHLLNISKCKYKSNLNDSSNNNSSNNDSSSDDSSSECEIIWANQELDDNPENTIKKLFHGAKNLPSKRPIKYNGNSIRTKKRKKAKAKKMAAKNGRTIDQLFLPTSQTNETSETNLHNDENSETDNDNNNNQLETSDMEIDVDKLIHLTKSKLQDKTLPPNQQWRISATLQYLRLLKFNYKKIDASLYVARQLGKNKYFAQQLRS